MKKMYGQKKVLVQKKFGSKNMICGPQNLVYKMLAQKNVGPKKFWSKK